MSWLHRKARKEDAIAELKQSKANLHKAERDLQKRLDQHLDTIERQSRMRHILEENHIADLMFEALSERRRKE
jgi:prefoldin subunit 5